MPMPTPQANPYPTPPESSQPTESGGPIDADPIPPNSSQPIEFERPIDLHYYLTEGLEGTEHNEYVDIRSFREAVDAQVAAFHSEKADEFPSPYLIFSPVTPRQLAKINSVRKTDYKKVRIFYFNEPQILIIKHMPGPYHELATKGLERIIIKKIDEGGQGPKILPIGCTLYQGRVNQKEADASFRPRNARPLVTDWPSVIVECGVFETAQRLTVDGMWWIDNSRGQVKLALLLFVNAKAKTIRIETWKKDTIENPQQTRGHDEGNVTRPTRQKIITITPKGITGTPLKLSFRDIFLRKPKRELGERNYRITEDDLKDYYETVWPASEDITSPAESCKSTLFSLINFL